MSFGIQERAATTGRISGLEKPPRLEIDRNGAGFNIVDLDETLVIYNTLWPLAVKQVADGIIKDYRYLVDLKMDIDKFGKKPNLHEYEILCLELLKTQARYLAGQRESRVVDHAVKFLEEEAELFEYVTEMFELSAEAGRLTWIATTQADVIAAAAMKKWEKYGVIGYSSSVLGQTDEKDPIYNGEVLYVLHGWDKGKVAQRHANGIDTSTVRISGFGKHKMLAMGNARSDLNMGPYVEDFVLVHSDRNTTRLARRRGYHTPADHEVIPLLREIFNRQSLPTLHPNGNVPELPMQ